MSEESVGRVLRTVYVSGERWLECSFIFFFFFQAEDGIRDHCVTGVQTCALPICSIQSGMLPQEDWVSKKVGTLQHRQLVIIKSGGADRKSVV